MNTISSLLARPSRFSGRLFALNAFRILALLIVAVALSAQSATAQVCDDLGTFDIDFNDPLVNPLRAPTALNAIQSGGQVFIAPCTGQINSISFYVSNGGAPSFPIVGSLKFWADQYLNPFTLLASVPVSIPAIGPQTVDLPGGVFVTAGQEYSFMVDPTSGSGTFEGSNDNNFIPNSNRFFGNATTGALEGAAGDANHAIVFGPAEYDQCSASDDLDVTAEVNSFANLIPTQGVGQILTAPCNGTIESFTVVADGTVFPIEGTVRVFFGSGGLGKEIVSAPYSIPGNGSYTVALPNVGVAGGEVYTVFFDAPTSGVGNLFGIGGADLYGGGTWVIGPDPASMVGLAFDLGFGITFGDFCIGSCEQFVALTKLYKSTNGDDWTDNTSWFAGSFPSDWFGVSGGDQEVWDIDLPNNNLTGTLTDDIGGLGFLQGGINLSGNQIGGTIPAGLTGITSGLRTLDLTGNNFTGSIPDLTPIAASLLELKLGDNNLSGPIPSHVWDLTQLRVLELYDNALTGTIPAAVGNLTNLTSLELASNTLSGVVPTEIGLLTSLSTLNLLGAGLSGDLPLSLSSLTNLLILQASSNAFTGPVPDVSGMSDLVILSLDNNQLTGSVPDLDGVDLPVLGEINLSYNNLTGSIPSNTYNLPSLSFLGLTGNQLTGSIPELSGTFNLTLTEVALADNQLSGGVPASVLCTINIRNLDLSANQLSGVVPDNGQTCGESWDELTSLELLNLSNNQFVGTVPPTLQGSESIQSLFLSSNEFDGLPDLTLVTSLVALDVSDNRFDFDDLAPNAGIVNITYAPQKTFGTAANISVPTGTSWELAFPSVGGAANTYEWQKDGSPVIGSDYALYNIGYLDGDQANPFDGAQASDAGDYQLQVTDTAVPGLTLESELYTVTVNAAFNAPDGYVFTEYATGLSNPQGVAFDAQGNTVVAATSSGEIFRYQPDGTPVDGVGVPLLTNLAQPIDVEVIGDLLFISSLDNDAIYRVDLTAITANSDIAGVQPTPWLQGLNGPTYMTTGPGGFLYFSEVKNPAIDKIRRVDPNSLSPTVSTVVEFPAADAEFPGGLNPNGLAFDQNGDLYVATQLGGDVRRIKNPTSATLPIAFSEVDVVFTGLDSPSGVDIGVDGKLYVTDRTAVHSATINSAVLTPFVTGLNGFDFNNAEFDAEGRLYVADGNSGTIFLTVAPERQVQTTGSITYLINQDSEAIVPGSTAAIDNAFAHWAAVSDAAVAVTNGGTTAVEVANATDGVNVVTFKDNDFPFAPFVLGVAGKLIEFLTADEAEIIDADVVFNPAFVDDPTFNFGTPARPGFFDIESIATHEVGHTFGMIHSGNPSSTMFFALPPGEEARSLELDDRAWIAARYPGPSFATSFGSIAGTITDGEDFGQPVAGALVLARNDATGETVHAYSDLSGDYLVPGLPTGDYTVSIQPLDGSVFGFPLQASAISVNLATITQNTGFQEEYYNSTESDDPGIDDPSDATLVPVVAGTGVTGINLTTNRDLAAPEVVAFSPGDASTDASVQTDVLITFSEPINIASLSVQIQDVATSTPVGGTLQLENDATFALITLQDPLAPSTDYEITIAAGLEDVRGNATAAPITSVFTTEPPDVDTPTVESVQPAAGATDVNTRDAITVSFSESMSPSSITAPGSFTVSSGAGLVDGIVTVDRDLNNMVAKFVSNLPLAEAVTYTINLSTAITDASGNALAAPFASSFTTVPAAAPAVLTVGPTDTQTAVDVETSVVIDFTESIDPASVTASSFSFTGPSGAVPGEFVFLLSDTRVVFDPTEPLEFSSNYTVALTTDIADVSTTTENLANPFASSFTTAAVPATPEIISVSPPSAVPGTIVVIAGSGFDPILANNVVSFNGTAAIVTDATLGSITTVVPEGATTGPLTVTVGGLPSNTFAFSVVASAISTDEAVGIVAAEGGARDTDTTPDGAFAYVTNSDANTVSVIDLASLTSLLPIQVGEVPYKIAINPAGTRAYVTNFASHTLSVIDIDPASPTYNQVTATIAVGLNPTGVAVSPDGSKVYVAEYTSKGVSIIEADPERGGFNAVTGRVATESGNSDVETSPDGTIMFVTGTAGLAIIDLDPASPTYNQVTARVASETETTDVETTPDGTFALVTTAAGEVLLIDIRPNADDPYKVVAKTSSEAGAEEVESGPDGTKFFVSNAGAGTVDVYNIEFGLSGASDGVTTTVNETNPVVSSGINLRKVDTIPVGTNPEGLVFAPSRNIIVVANSGSGDVSVISFAADVDGDGLSADEEALLGTDPTKADTDGDGVIDSLDEFPLDSGESGDFDLDGIGNNIDLDDDNDGLLDVDEGPAGTNAFDADTDDDEVFDGVEVTCGTDPQSINDFPMVTIGGSVTGDGVGLVGLAVKLLDGDNPTIILAETVTEAGGVYDFGSWKAERYEIMVRTPTGFRTVVGTDNPSSIAPSCVNNVFDFPMEAFVIVNDAEKVSYWKHQFDAHAKDDGDQADETLADLLTWIGQVKERYTDPYYQTLFADETDGLDDDIAEWHVLLSAKVPKGSQGNKGTLKKKAKAEAEIGSLVLNVMSLKIGQTEVVSEDGHDVGDVIGYASQLVIDPSTAAPDLSLKNAYKLAEKIAKNVNKQKTIKSGVLPDCSSEVMTCDRLYKYGGEGEAENHLNEANPDKYQLDQNYPNPFAPHTTIRYGLPQTAHVTIEVFNMLGKRVRTVVDAEQPAGFYEVRFNGGGLASGLYFYRMIAGDFVQIQKMTLSK